MKKPSLRSIYIVSLSAILILAMIALLFFDYKAQTKQAEDALVEEARTFSREMDAVWDFMDNSQPVINYTKDGEYEFKRLHCAIVGKSVGALFSAGSDYLIRYTNFEPRNIQGKPDAFETLALNAFYSNDEEREYYRVTEYKDKKSFRYLRALTVEESCLECHGEPKGEIDITGKVKEGWKLGGVGGAISIVIPYEQRSEAITHNVKRDMVFMLILMLTIAFLVYFITTKSVIRPLNRIEAAFDEMGDGRLDMEIENQPLAKEISKLTERFNEMSGELRDIYGNLESQVVSRTLELTKANQELENQRSNLQELSAKLAKEVNFKSDLLSMVNHELRTPLTSIIALAQFALESEAQLTKNGRRVWQEISNNGKTLLEMINNMLDIARSDAGEMRANIEPMDLGDIVSLVRSMIEPLANRYCVSFKSHVESSVPLVEGDFEKTQRMLENLCSNAIKFTPDDGDVSLSVMLDESSGEVYIKVSDTGIGIAEEDQKRIFERFVQVDSTSTRKYNGSGLGLAIVKEYATMQGFTIDVCSELGKGSVFTIVIPASKTLSIRED